MRRKTDRSASERAKNFGPAAGDGLLVAVLAITRTPAELWELSQLLARAAVVAEQEQEECEAIKEVLSNED